MAVPVPNKSKRTNKILPQTNLEQGLRLEYPGKKTIEEILAIPPGIFYSNPAFNSIDNRLYHGDNLAVLAALAQDKLVVGKIKLVYIDPPFATASAFESRKQQHAYDDNLIGPAFVESLRERLIFIHYMRYRCYYDL